MAYGYTQRMGDVLLKPASGWLGPAITFFTGGDYSHAMIAWDDLRIVDVRWPGGGRVRTIDEVEGDYHIYRHGDGVPPDRLDDMHQAIERGKDIGYDLPQFFFYIPMKMLRFIDWFRAPNRLDSRNRYICSELVQRAYRAAGIDVTPGVDPGDATPADLADSSQLYRVW